MKKQVILIYDLEKDVLTHVCDVRDMTSDQFEKVKVMAKKNVTKLLKENHDKEKKRNDEIDAMHETSLYLINNLRVIIAHLLGYTEMPDEELKRIFNDGYEPNREIEEYQEPLLDNEEPVELVEEEKHEEE